MMFFLFCLFITAECCRQKTFSGVIVTLTESDGNTYKQTIRECIDPVTTSSKVTHIRLTNQVIISFNEGAIADLEELLEINLNKNFVYETKSNGFVNLPKIRTIDLSLNTLQIIQAESFHNLPVKKIILSGNNISLIEADAFSHLPNLEIVLLDRNNLAVCDGQWFWKTQNLNAINASKNYITQLNRLDQVNNLQTLDLRENRLISLNLEAFSGMKRLKTLDLSYCGLKQINFDTLSDCQNLEDLFLHGNNLTFLSERLLNDLAKSMGTIYIHSNPWECSCYHSIINWALNNRVQVDVNNHGCVDMANPVCVVGLSNPRKCVEEVNEELYHDFYQNFDFSYNHSNCFVRKNTGQVLW